VSGIESVGAKVNAMNKSTYFPVLLTCLVMLAACGTDQSGLSERIAQLEHELGRTKARGEIENVYNRYQYLHTVFEDEKIITDLWVKEGTPGVSAQYTNTGVYNTWDSVMAYHRDRPSPKGKLLIHYNSSPVIEVAKDGQSAKGVWITAGVESGLAAPENAEKAPQAFFEDSIVNGQSVWAHWTFARHHLDFLKQDGESEMKIVSTLLDIPYEEVISENFVKGIKLNSSFSNDFPIDLRYRAEDSLRI